MNRLTFLSLKWFNPGSADATLNIIRTHRRSLQLLFDIFSDFLADVHLRFLLTLLYYNFIMYYPLFTALLALSVGGALALNSSDILRCGNGDLPTEMLQVSKSMARETTIAVDRTLGVDVFFHVVSTEANKGVVTDQMLTDQVRQRIRLGFIRGLPESEAPKSRESGKHSGSSLYAQIH